MVGEIGLRFGCVFCVACWLTRTTRDAAADVRVLIAFEEDAVGGSLGHRPMQMDFVAGARCCQVSGWLWQIQAWRLRRRNHAAGYEEGQNGGQRDKKEWCRCSLVHSSMFSVYSSA